MLHVGGIEKNSLSHYKGRLRKRSPNPKCEWLIKRSPHVLRVGARNGDSLPFTCGGGLRKRSPYPLKRMHYHSLVKLHTWKTCKIIWLMDNDLNMRVLERSSLILYNGGLNPLCFTYEGHGKRSPILYIRRVHQSFPHLVHHYM